MQIAVVTACCLLVLLVVPTILSFAVSVVAAPVNITKTWLMQSGQSFPQYFRNRSELIDEISYLRSELASAGGDHFTAKTLLQENAELRSLLGDEGEARILAGIIGRPGMLPHDTLMLDQGSRDGVFVGAPVYIGDNTVIGVVKSVAMQTALVELITTPGFEATVYIIGPNIYTNAVGMGGGQLRVGVPQGIPLTEGDMVVLPSITSGVYGEISVVQSEPSRPEQYGYVSPDMPLASIRFVSVGTTPMRSVTFEAAEEMLSGIKARVFTVPVPEDVLINAGFDNATVTSTTTDQE